MEEPCSMKESCKENTCCFTGHRALDAGKLPAIRIALEKAVEQHIEKGYCWFAAGGALGFDTVAEITVLDLKKKYPQIRLWLILPCKNQADRWSRTSRDTYERILAQADRVEYICEEHMRGCMHMRNRRLVQESSSCICYLRKSGGGTYFTVDVAQKSGIPVYNLAGH